MGPDKTQDRAMVVMDTKMKQIKKRRSTNIFKVALYMMRRGKSSTKASVQAEVASKSLWKKLFGTTTKLRLENKAAAIVPEDDQKQLNQLVSLEIVNIKPAFVNFNEVVKEKVIVPQLDNPHRSPSCASSSSCSEESRYASALNLRELDVCEEEKKYDNVEEDDEDGQFDDSAGDSMIDVKAELFIAQFYEQVRLQNSQNQVIRG